MGRTATNTADPGIEKLPQQLRGGEDGLYSETAAF
jgi:hypothetical protein